MNLREVDKRCQEIQEMVLGTRKVNRKYDIDNHEIELIEGMKVFRDIPYKSEFPNNILDIWLNTENSKKKRPTIIYFHGGGFLFGDKEGGDPLSSGWKKNISFIKKIVSQGYHVISCNYAFAPEYRFPTQVIQVNEILKFINEVNGTFNIDKNNLFLMGSSAGAILTAIYGAVIANSEYAAKLNIDFVSVGDHQIKGLIIDEAVLNIEYMDDNLKILTQTFLGVDNIDDPNGDRLYDIGNFINENYPSSFVIGSNMQSSFNKYANSLVNLLEEKSISYELFNINSNIELLEHGFMMRFETNEYAEQCFNKVLAFIEKKID